MVSRLVVTTKQADCVSTGGRSRGMSRLAILAAWVLPVVGAPALAQTIVTQGVSGNSFIAGQAVTYNSLSISPYLSPGMLLLTTTNAASATSPAPFCPLCPKDPEGALVRHRLRRVDGPQPLQVRHQL